jgi:hypothetical protein
MTEERSVQAPGFSRGVSASNKVVKRAFKYRFYPTPDQAELLCKTFGCVRYVYGVRPAPPLEQGGHLPMKQEKPATPSPRLKPHVDWCAICRANPASGDGWDPRSCAECIAARREAANEMLAQCYAASAYRCCWCGHAARHPHLDWCGCAIPAQARSD